jgi:hypothetical protein
MSNVGYFKPQPNIGDYSSNQLEIPWNIFPQENSMGYEQDDLTPPSSNPYPIAYPFKQVVYILSPNNIHLQKCTRTYGISNHKFTETEETKPSYNGTLYTLT